MEISYLKDVSLMTRYFDQENFRGYHRCYAKMAGAGHLA
jgi:hypothetical protein